jgi:hypothetical protein
VRWKRRRRRLVHCEFVEIVFQDIADAFVGTDPDRQGTATGRFQTSVGLTFAQAENAQARTIGLLGMSP